MSVLGVIKGLSIIQPAVGLMLLAVSIYLVKRTRDLSVWIMGGWGALWVLTAVWDMFVRSAYLQRGVAPPDGIQFLSGMRVVAGQTGLLVTALYSAWRLWQKYG